MHDYRTGVSVLYFLLASLLACACMANQEDVGLMPDLAMSETDGSFKKGSHVKLYLPNLPYAAISHALNGALFRPANNQRGWQYDLAKSHTNQHNRVWEFELRRNAYFQDGSHFNADSVLENITAFQRQPFSFSRFASVLSHVEKVDDYRVRFYMKEPYGAFPYDAIWLQFYTSKYLEKHGWNGKPTCPNLVEPGRYGIGPYILTKGYVEGDRRSPIVELVANDNYWGDEKPKVERITLNLDIPSDEAFNAITKTEGLIDVMPIAFANQVETVLSRHAKLASALSKNNYAMHFNFVSGKAAINDPAIRRVINGVIDQEYLLNLSMLGEGVLSPTMVSPNFYKLDAAISKLDGYLAGSADQAQSIQSMREVVAANQRRRGLDPNTKIRLRVIAQESFLFLIRDIRYFLSQVNIELEVVILPTEEEVFQQLHVTWNGGNTKPWDLLLWGNTDWYKHPWSAFFVYMPSYAWSTLPDNALLDRMISQLFSAGLESDEYVGAVANIVQYVHENNLMVFLPTPNNVFAVNKEVKFKPGSSAFVYLRELEVTDKHWSLRKEAKLPEQRMAPVEIYRRSSNY